MKSQSRRQIIIQMSFKYQSEIDDDIQSITYYKCLWMTGQSCHPGRTDKFLRNITCFPLQCNNTHALPNSYAKKPWPLEEVLLWDPILVSANVVL